MIAFIHEVVNIAEQYGLQITGLDATDVTLMVRMEVMPSGFYSGLPELEEKQIKHGFVIGKQQDIWRRQRRRHTARAPH